MSKVISISSYRKQKTHPKQMDYESTWAIKDKFELASCIIDELFLAAEECIRDCGFNPADFSLDDKAAKSCLSTDLNEFFEGGEEALELTYTANIDGTRYAVVSDASVEGEDVLFNTAFVKWNGREWLEYADGRWGQGPGSNFI